jgi:ABC-type molybdate transport system ATPase subunit
VLLHKNLLHEHMHVLGGSGSGKTSCVLAPLVTQLIRAGDSAVVIIDLKGEMAFFESVRLECERSKRTFKYFRTCRVHSGEQVKRNGRTVRR